MTNYDPTDLRGQDRIRKAEAEKKRLAQENEAGDLAWLLSSKKGRRIMWRLLDLAGVTRISFDTNALRMAFNEGNRNYGNMVLAWILADCPERFIEMLREFKDGNSRSDAGGNNPTK